MQTTYYLSPAVERAMKIQEMILPAIEGRLKRDQAAQILGISDHNMRRCKRHCEQRGYDGLFDWCRQQPSPRRVLLERERQVFTLTRVRYFYLNVLHFYEEQTRSPEKAKRFLRGRRAESHHSSYRFAKIHSLHACLRQLTGIGPNLLVCAGDGFGG